LEKPELAKQIAQLAAKAPEEIELEEVQTVFASNDPRIADVRGKIMDAIRAATRYADTT
jgi:hypothetical protein